MIEQYLLQDELGYYWIWYKGDDMEKANLNGPHSYQPINLPVKKVKNPLIFKPDSREQPHD